MPILSFKFTSHYLNVINYVIKWMYNKLRPFIFNCHIDKSIFDLLILNRVTNAFLGRNFLFFGNFSNVASRPYILFFTFRQIFDLPSLTAVFRTLRLARRIVYENQKEARAKIGFAVIRPNINFVSDGWYINGRSNRYLFEFGSISVRSLPFSLPEYCGIK